MKKRTGAVVAALCVGLASASFAVIRSADAGTEAPQTKVVPDTLIVPGDAYYPESITAAANGDLYVASITTGEIVKFKAGVWTAEQFVAPGVNIGTAGVYVDDARKVLWACDIDLSFQQPTELRAFSLSTKQLVASYVLPDQGVCADIAIAGGHVYITDTTNPMAGLPGRILKLKLPRYASPVGGTLSVWSADPLFTKAGVGLQINGLTYDGAGTFYTSNYGSGQLLRVRVAGDGSAKPAEDITPTTPFVNPDGIRALDRNRIVIAENPGRLSVFDVRSRTVTVIANLDQPTSVVRSGANLWVAEGQVLRLQQGQAPNLPFKVQRVPAPAGV